MKESQIQKAILDYLTLRGHFFTRINSGAFKTERGGFYRMAVPGYPDLVGCVESVFYGIEVKTSKGQQSMAQKLMQSRIEKAGGKYLLARSLDDVLAAGL